MIEGGSSPRFDESLASVARGLHLGAVAAGALVGAAVLFLWLERRGRSRWAEVPVTVSEAAHGPYRSSAFVTAHLARAPRLVRAASFASLFVGYASTPLILLALTRFPFDGVSIPLVPGLALVLVNAVCGWLLLARSRHAVSAARAGAQASLVANVGLALLTAGHIVMVELGRRDGIEHACSSSVTFVAMVFAVVSVLQAMLTIAAVRAHADVLAWGAGHSSASVSASESPSQ
jgi:hypothetical protein